MQVDRKQRYLMITEAAYFLAEQRNFAPGHEEADWLTAERQVDEMLEALAQPSALVQLVESSKQAKLPRKTAPTKAKAQSRAKAATGDRNIATTKQAAVGHTPSEAAPQQASTSAQQPEAQPEAPAKRGRKPAKIRQAAPNTASSREESNPARKTRPKKVESVSSPKGDGRRRAKTASI